MNAMKVFTVVCVCAAHLFSGCGRDALRSPHMDAAPPPEGVVLECPGFDGAPRIAPLTTFEPRKCTFPGNAAATPQANMLTLVRLVLGFEDAMVASELSAQGLAAERSADRETIIKRLLNENAARNLSDEWLGHWLDLPMTTPAETISPSLWDDLRSQTLRHGRAVFIEGTMALDSFVNSRSSFANTAVGKYYGVTAPASGNFGVVDLPPERVGVLGHGAVLGSHPSAASRGNLLAKAFTQCESAPPPPAGLVPHDRAHTTLLARKELEQQFKMPVCAGCHSLLEPGFLLHNFDERGAVRSMDTDGAVLNTRVQFLTRQLQQLSASDLSSFGAQISSDGSWKTCLAVSLIDIAANRTKRPLSRHLDDHCEPAMLISRQMAKSPLMFETVKLLSAIVLGGQVLDATVSDLPGPPPAPSLGVDGLLSECTPVRSQDITCRSVCQNNAQACTKEICRLDGTLGQAFTFTDLAQCEAGRFTTVESQSCDQPLSAQACKATPIALRWVRCCCE